MRTVIILIFLFSTAVYGCMEPNDIRQDVQDSAEVNEDVRRSLSELEDTYTGFNYHEIINRHSPVLPDGMSITRFKHFVIFSDLDEETTYHIIDNDIRQTIDGMVNGYVNRTPDSVTAVFLFRNFEDYKDFTLKNTDIDEEDLSPYGYYKITQNIIVVRYVEWKGSTKHEIAHRYTKADFPDAPSWFDEGLSSLLEKSRYENGKLIGEFSWRIVALRRAIKDGNYTKLGKMMRTNDEQLYSKRVSYYYAQSRYLLMYLEEKGLLETYYKTFRDTYRQDKTGITQLEKLLGKSLNEIDEDYYSYITSFNQ